MYYLAVLFEDDVVKLLNLRLGVSLPKEGVALEGVGESIPPRRQRLYYATARFDHEVEDPDGCVREVLDGVDAVALSRDDLDDDLTIVGCGLGDLGGGEVAVARLAQLEVLGQIDPELEPHVGGAVRVLARHFGVHYTAAGCHELQIAWIETP